MVDLLPFPTLTIEQDEDDDAPMWSGDVILDGKPLPWAVLSGPKIEMTPEGLTILTVAIPVRLRIVPRSKP